MCKYLWARRPVARSFAYLLQSEQLNAYSWAYMFDEALTLQCWFAVLACHFKHVWNSQIVRRTGYNYIYTTDTCTVYLNCSFIIIWSSNFSQHLKPVTIFYFSSCLLHSDFLVVFRPKFNFQLQYWKKCGKPKILCIAFSPHTAPFCCSLKHFITVLVQIIQPFYPSAFCTIYDNSPFTRSQSIYVYCPII